jgi:pyruvate/2-oxoglutarate dehydrogenase complex dihydrolipoamide acyltransferase (E2) component
MRKGISMWRKRRSALFFDFENIPTRASPENIASLVAWLEDGKFDEEGGRRKLLSKTIYWNSAAERHRDVFEAAGFEVVLCEKFSNMKNGADIRMALDIAETCWRKPEIKEFILFTTDSDFVPVLQRLAEKSKVSAILVNESHPDRHTAFGIFADLLIPRRQLAEALTYKRSKQGLLANLRKPPAKPRGSSSPAPAATPAAANAGSTDPAPVPQARKAAKPQADELLAEAERAVVRIAGRTPKKHVSRRKIEGQLQQIPGFKKTGAGAYFGFQDYLGLMLELAKRDKRIKVLPGRSRSASVMYVPDN